MKGEHKTCPNCGTGFKDESRAGNKRYCSTKCGYTWRTNPKNGHRIVKGEVTNAQFNKQYAKMNRELVKNLGLVIGQHVFDPSSERRPSLAGVIKKFDHKYGTAEILCYDGERMDVNVVFLEVNNAKVPGVRRKGNKRGKGATA